MVNSSIINRKIITYVIFSLFFSKYLNAQNVINDTILYKYSYLKSETSWEPLDMRKMEIVLSGTQYLLNTKECTPTVSKIDTFKNCITLVVTLPPNNPDIVNKLYWLSIDGKFIGLGKTNVVEIINEYLYRDLTVSDYPALVDFYNNISFNGKEVKFYNQFDKNIFVIKEDFDLYNCIYKSNDHSSLVKKYEIVDSNNIKESHDIHYYFYWNRFEVKDILNYRK